MRGAGSAMCELTNQSRLGVQEGGTLKRQDLKTERYRDSMRKFEH